MSGKDIQIKSKDGGTFTGYLASPPGGKGPGVVVIQEIFGINANMRAITDEIAAKGYFALAPDLFWRMEPGVQLDSSKQADWDKAFALYQQFDVDTGVKDLVATMDHLRELPGSNGKVGCQGYCLGGLLAYLMATRSNIDAAVGYYGVGIDGKLDEAKNIRSQLLLHIAKEDGFVDAKAQKAIHDALDGNARVMVCDYPGVDHGFCRPGGDHYNKEQAEKANAATAEFLARHLKG